MEGTSQSVTETHMAVLRIYVAAHCLGCATAREMSAYVRRNRPHQPVEVIDLDQPGSVRPPHVFGVPTYCLDDQVISLGNPDGATLLAFLDQQDNTDG